MLKEAKQWVAALETALNKLSTKYGESVEALDKKFEDFYDNGGSGFDLGGPYKNSVEAFYASYENDIFEQEDAEDDDDDGEEGG